MGKSESMLKSGDSILGNEAEKKGRGRLLTLHQRDANIAAMVFMR